MSEGVGFSDEQNPKEGLSSQLNEKIKALEAFSPSGDIANDWNCIITTSSTFGSLYPTIPSESQDRLLWLENQIGSTAHIHGEKILPSFLYASLWGLLHTIWVPLAESPEKEQGMSRYEKLVNKLFHARIQAANSALEFYKDKFLPLSSFVPKR